MIRLAVLEISIESFAFASETALFQFGLSATKKSIFADSCL
jgi:hypothetical protein